MAEIDRTISLPPAVHGWGTLQSAQACAIIVHAALAVGDSGPQRLVP